MARDVIFIHGMWSHAQVASPLTDYLIGEGFSLHCPELPHHGPEQDLAALAGCSLKTYEDAIVDYIKIRRIQRPILIGHSMGGLVAQLVAALIEVESIVLLNSAAPAGVNHIFPRSFWSTRSIYLRLNFWSHVNRLPFSVAKDGLFCQLDLDKARQIYEALLYESGRVYAEIVYWWLDRRRSSRIEGCVSGRKLIVSAGRDRVVRPGVARALSGLYPDADFNYYPGNGHWIFAEPGDELIYRDIAEWLSVSQC